MGGNIWKEQSVRLELKDYLIVLQEVKALLEEHIVLDKNEIKEIAYIKNKADFGDLDLLLTSRFEHKTFLIKYLENSEMLYKVNGDVVSFLYKNFQVDIIFVNASDILYAKNYFSWNDAGNLVGRMIKQLGFKHGHNGLYYINRQDTQVLSETCVSKDYLDALRILKLDTSLFLKGFDTKEQLFNWVIASPYFNKDIFKFENLNHTNKVRDRKRATYNDFLKYLETLPDKTFNYKFDRQSIAVYHYPFLADVLTSDLKRSEDNLKIKGVFNGEVFTKLLNIYDKPLGAFIKYFKSKYSSEYLLMMADTKTNEEISDFILAVYLTYQISLTTQVL